jgi:hypothetical protein
MQHLEATSGASRTARGSTGTLAGLQPMARVKNAVAREGISRGRSGIPTVCCGGQQAQSVVRVSDMDGKRNLSAKRSTICPHASL